MHAPGWWRCRAGSAGGRGRPTPARRGTAAAPIRPATRRARRASRRSGWSPHLQPVRAVGAGGRETEGAVKTDGRVVRGIDEQHPDGDAAVGERREAGGGEGAPEASTVPTRVGADHVDLTQRVRL